MKRIQEKVKDIVEARNFGGLTDFTADPALTLSNYHFTDITADLMSKWLGELNRVTAVNGITLALAGYRGVGKSHFLATLGAIISQPELRSRVSEPLVSASAHRLMRRHYPVVYVRRGLGETLLDELKSSLTVTLGIDLSACGNSLEKIIERALTHTGDLPLTLMVDTAFERGSRVARDDGQFLGELAEISKQSNVFLCVALDDDIAGADGINAAIARTFTIDYLDQEHLYKIVNTNIFPKKSQLLPVVIDVYNYFREVIPHFNWSQQRFTSLYPLHPAILEIAPFVRLYVHSFALLNFTAAAGEKIMGRPANSLIALDEVFDNAESELRKVDDLRETFKAYDKLNNEVVSNIPVMQRLQAKLILKSLLLLSLEGRGTTAGEICASMLIFDESDPMKAVGVVENILGQFANAMPGDISVIIEPGKDTRYGFRVVSKDNLNNALTEKIKGQSQEAAYEILRRLFIEKFNDCTFSSEYDDVRKDWMDCQIEWRGGRRRGRVIWNSPGDSVGEFAVPPANSNIDWEVAINWANAAEKIPQEAGVSRIIWKPDTLRSQELELLLRYNCLMKDAGIREEFADQVRAALHSHAVAAEQILNRAILDDGSVVIEGFDYNLTDEARNESAISGVLSAMLEPYFETLYPSHPYFSESLGMSEVAGVVSSFFSGRQQDSPEAQNFAKTFAQPLGLATEVDGKFVAVAGEELKKLEAIQTIRTIIDNSSDGSVSLSLIYDHLKKAPYGLVREAQHLLLSAMVADRQIEFVTAKGDRINRRSLDLKIIWGDIVGIALPPEAAYSVERLKKWALLITKIEVNDLNNNEERAGLQAAFEHLTGEWKRTGILQKFNEISDEALNVSTWRKAALAGKTLNGVIENMEWALEDKFSVEECLNRIGDIFLDSEEKLNESLDAIKSVESFVEGYRERERIRLYLAQCDITGNENVERLRYSLSQSVENGINHPSAKANMELGYVWDRFYKEFSELFIEQHDFVMKSHYVQEKYDEIVASDKWWEYQNISNLHFFNKRFTSRIKELELKFKEIDCSFDVKRSLASKPNCICSFTPGNKEQWEKLPELLWAEVSASLEDYRSNLIKEKVIAVNALRQIAEERESQETSFAAESLVRALIQESSLPQFSDVEIAVLRKMHRRIINQRTGVQSHAEQRSRSEAAETIEPEPRQSESESPDFVLTEI